MKIPLCFLSALVAATLHVGWSTAIGAVADNEDSEMERIVGGQSATEGQFPWAASLYRDNSFICTCSIISANTVLTAAHCVVNNGVTGPARSFHAIANVDRRSPTVRINFTSVRAHPNYSESGIRNDIAYFRTTEPIPFSDTVQPICIARSDTDAMEYGNATAMGWGSTTRVVAILYPNILQFVSQRIVRNDNAQCRFYYGTLEDSKICAGELLRGICNGDSGGPLVYLSQSMEPVQIGIASYGNRITGCGTISPSVWTRVSSFNSFIREGAAGDELCEI